MGFLHRSSLSHSRTADFTGPLDDMSNPLCPAMVALQQGERLSLIGSSDQTAKAAAHVEDLMHLILAHPGSLLDQIEDRRHRSGSSI